METVNIHEAKTHLSRLIAKGEPFIIAKSGKPIYKAVPIEEPAAIQRLGFMVGEFTIPDDFKTMFKDDIDEMFDLNRK
jgi:antitoxin (DNA-binding transcriptional repressor) of toxin-antitoxin stability system